MTLKSQVEQLVGTMYRAGITYSEGVDAFKCAFIVFTLEGCRWNACKAARILGMHRNTLSRTMAELKIERPAPKKPVEAERKTKPPVKDIWQPRRWWESAS